MEETDGFPVSLGRADPGHSRPAPVFPPHLLRLLGGLLGTIFDSGTNSGIMELIGALPICSTPWVPANC